MSIQREVWETIADSWTNLRVKPEGEVIDFSKKINIGPILDVGCGNGRNSLPFLQKKLKCIELDFSRSMIREAKKFLKKRKFKPYFIVASVTNLPFKNNVFSTVIFVRVLPHVRTREKRLDTLSEIKRVSKNFVISCWYKWDRKLFWIVLKKLCSSDVYIDWDYHGKVYKRFHHLYTKKELEEDLKKVSFKNFKSWNDKKGNIWCST